MCLLDYESVVSPIGIYILISMRCNTPVKSLILFCFVSFYFQEASSDMEGLSNWYLAPAGFYQSDSLKQTSTLDNQTVGGDIRLGYQIMPSLYLGGIYAIENIDIGAREYSNPADNYTKKTRRTSYGGTLAYFFGAPFIMASYFAKSSWAWSTSDSTGQRNLTYDGWGWDVHLGYRFAFGGLLLGPEIVYRNWIYTDKIENGATLALNPTLKETRIDPMISAWYMF